MSTQQNEALSDGEQKATQHGALTPVVLACGSRLLALGIARALSEDDRIEVMRGASAQPELMGLPVSARTVLIVDQHTRLPRLTALAAMKKRVALLAALSEPSPLATDLIHAIGGDVLSDRLLPQELCESVVLAATAKELLTHRELDVYHQLRRGASYQQAATVLGIGVETVRSHAVSVYRKLGLRGKPDLMAAPFTPRHDE